MYTMNILQEYMALLIEKELRTQKDKYPVAMKGEPFEVEWEKVPGERKGYHKDFRLGEPRISKYDKKLINLLRKHMKESVVREYVRSLLVEDVTRRKQLAQDLRLAGAKESSPIPSAYTSHEEYVQLVKDARSGGRLLKKAFAKNADRAFLDSLVTVHWFYSGQTMRQFIGGSFSSKDELSTAAYLPGEIKGAGKFGNYGILIKGHITLLANDMDQIYTGSTDAYDEVFPERKKQSGTNKGAQQIYEPEGYEEYKILVLDKEDWNPQYSNRSASQNNEALVDNWSPMAIIVPDSSNTADIWDEDLLKMEPAGPDTAEAEIVWQPLLDKAGLDIPVMTHKEFTSRGWN